MKSVLYDFGFNGVIHLPEENKVEMRLSEQSKVKSKRSCVVQMCNKSSTQSLTWVLTNWKWKSFPSWQIMFSLASGALSVLGVSGGGDASGPFPLTLTAEIQRLISYLYWSLMQWSRKKPGLTIWLQKQYVMRYRSSRREMTFYPLGIDWIVKSVWIPNTKLVACNGAAPACTFQES